MDWTYLNPFWHRDALLTSSLPENDSRGRLKAAATNSPSVARSWLGRGDATLYVAGGRIPWLFEMHVRVSVTPDDRSSTIRLRFSGGLASSLLLAAIDVVCPAAAVWAIVSLIEHGWSYAVGAGLVSVLIPPLLILALRSTADRDQQRLTDFVVGAIESAEPG